MTMTAGWQKLFSPDPKLGFLAHAHVVEGQIATGALPAAIKTVADARRVIFNDYLDAAVAGFFMISVVVILARQHSRVVRGARRTKEGRVVGGSVRRRIAGRRLSDVSDSSSSAGVVVALMQRQS